MLINKYTKYKTIYRGNLDVCNIICAILSDQNSIFVRKSRGTYCDFILCAYNLKIYNIAACCMYY